MTVLDLIGNPGEDMIFEGPRILEFLTMCRQANQYLDYPRLERAVRIVGKEPNRDGNCDVVNCGEIFGYVCGRAWAAEY